ncbi:unnamed protein product [Pieris brassicae]|uniref:Endonuclease/exonuclease/phosphatase domain-containing protein n=1 Tax=Pieris brassicae TaxID=7116 RepID=A0A9P0XGP4_PIEBR|nr:unnamed protein product [Pieris brassicae]
MATKELPALARNLDLSVCLVQEQYPAARLPGLYQHDVAPMAGIIVLRDDLAVLVLRNLCTSHCFVAQLGGGENTVYVVSAYFQYKDEIAPHLEHLERVLEALRGKCVVIGVDTNTHSQLWYSREDQCEGRGRVAEQRRTAMESFVLSWGLLVHNVQGQPDTFSSPNGSSNIDATLGTRGVRIDGWTVHADLSASDHRLITFVIHLGSASSSGQLHQARSSEQGMEIRRYYNGSAGSFRETKDFGLRGGYGCKAET